MLGREDGIWRNIFRHEEADEADEDQLKTLQKVPVFSELNKRDLKRISQIAHHRHYTPEEVIVREGQPSAGMYVILAGEVHITRRSTQGLEIDIANMETGDFFGDVGLLDSAPRTATVTAITECDVLGFFRPELLGLIESNPKLACKLLFKLAQVVAARLRFTDAQLEKFAELAQRLETEEANLKAEEANDA